MAPARAGVGRVEHAPPLGVPMMGYGARDGAAAGRHDPLFVRALFLASRSGAALLVEIDVCLMAVDQAADLRERIASRTGLTPGQITIGCIHTHSGPDTGLMAVLLGRPTPKSVEPLFRDVVEAAARAVESAMPAKLGVGSAPVAIGRNRRVEGGPVDPEALVLRVDRVDDSPLAVLYVHGCHPTALGHDNLDFSADWPGAAARAIEAALPGCVAIFALGAHADVDPRTRGLLDLAIPNQSVGVSFDEMEALGREAGDAVVRAALHIETSADFEVASASMRVPVPVHASVGGEAGRDAVLDRRRAEALEALALPPDLEPGVAEWYRLEGKHTAGLPPEDVRARSSRVRLLLRDQTSRRIAGGLEPEVEVQVLGLGPVWLLGLPLEVCVDVGEAWREAIDGPGAIVSIANGWLRYLPHADHFVEPDAEQRYEILNSTFVPEAANLLVRTGLELRAKLTSEGRSVRSMKGAT
jgi:hypothetical protein